MSTGDPARLSVRTPEEVLGLVGRDLGPSAWLEVDQERVDGFARTVEDWHWAHNEPEVASRGPFGGPIVHAHLTLTLTVHLFLDVLRFETGGTAMFYGYDRVRFPTAVRVGAQVRLHSRVARVEDLGGVQQLTVDHRVEVEDEDRPACAAQALWRHYPIGAPD
jgi:acyl dehydratase